MSVWIREILGWLLLGCGIAFFFLAYDDIKGRRLFNAVPLCFIGYVVFRGGLHLIKVATAARTVNAANYSESVRSAHHPSASAGSSRGRQRD